MKLLIKDMRLEKGMTIKKLSNISGVSKSYISELENGFKVPTVEVICKLSKALECNPEDLYKCE